MEFRPGVVSPAEFFDRKGQCTSRQLSMLVASAEFKKHQSRKPPSARRSIDAAALVSAALLIMCSLLLAEGLRPGRPVDPLTLEPKVHSFWGPTETHFSLGRFLSRLRVFDVMTTGCKFETAKALPVGNSKHTRLCRRNLGDHHVADY